MDKLLIVNNNLHIGGVQKALISLLWNIREQYDITLLLFYAGGELMKELPPDIRVITPDGAYRYLGMTRQDAVSWEDRLGRGFYGAVTRVFGRKYAVALMALGQKSLGAFDAAVSYLHNSSDRAFYGGCNEFVLRHVSAKKKVAFLHCDYSLCGGDTLENAAQYAMFDVIAACSRGCAEAFLRCNPNLREKVTVVPNCHRFEQIRNAADAAPAALPRDTINIVTVARFGREKGVERALRVIGSLGSLQKKLHYYLVGDGILKKEILAAVEEENLGECVTLCGMQENPYGYIRSADLLLIPSYSEAAPLVIGEAACLGTPVLSTETSSAREMIESTGYGWVCENTEEAMKETLENLLAQPDRLHRKKARLEQSILNNDLAVSGFAECIRTETVKQ